MNHPSARPDVTPSRMPEEGWHSRHYYYTINRQVTAGMSAEARSSTRNSIASIFQPVDDKPVEQLQTYLVSGHKADFGFIALDPDPLRVDALHQRLMASPLGPALLPTYSFVSITEISEYVPTTAQYAERLVLEGMHRDSPAFMAKVKAYEQREPVMRAQRLTPKIPDWPAMCFYPMNKKRVTGENWFMTPFSRRSEMMSEHARSGMAFAGKVTQLITVSVGLDDWEWGVTLWAKNPQYLTEIVYRMRFDEASARYAEFGPFYAGYPTNVDEILSHCLI